MLDAATEGNRVLLDPARLPEVIGWQPKEALLHYGSIGLLA